MVVFVRRHGCRCEASWLSLLGFNFLFVMHQLPLRDPSSFGAKACGPVAIVFLFEFGTTRFKQPVAPWRCREQGLCVGVLRRYKNISGSTRFNDLTF